MKLLDIFKMGRKKQKVTLVLGGGSARGIAHIGVLKVLEREGVPIDSIMGTSMGALVGAAYSVGVPLNRMEEIACGFTWDKLADFTFPKMAIIAGKRLGGVIEDILDSKTFEDMRIPMYVVTTDIERNEEIAHSSGDLKTLVRASCSWPGVFNPVQVGDRLLVDGGVKNSVPTRMARELCDGFMIASDVGFCVKIGKIDNILQMMLQSFQIMGEELNRYQSNEADVIIKSDLGEIDQAAFNRSREIIKKGEDAAETKIGEIKERLGIKHGLRA